MIEQFHPQCIEPGIRGVSTSEEFGAAVSHWKNCSGRRCFYEGVRWTLR